MLENIRGKKVLIMGLGLHGGGVGTVKFLAKKGAELTITDLRTQKTLRPALKNLKGLKKIHYVLGRHCKDDFQNADLIIKNPGVKPDSPFLKIAKRRKIPITSDIGIFFKECPGKIIGVTGTRGKSTTAYLLWAFLKEKFKNRTDRQIFLAGNIRKSVLEILPKVGKNDLVVLELSSFQLHDLAQEKQSPAPNLDSRNRFHLSGENIQNTSPAPSRQLNLGGTRNSPNFGDGAGPAIAAITNIFPDHLNWHKNLADYIKAKGNIFAFQNARDLLFIAKNDDFLRKLVKNAPAKIILVNLPNVLKNIVDQNLGEHYRNSAALAVAVAKHFRVEEKTIRKILKKFKGLEGRQELIAKIKGISWINDTTSTIPEAAMAALTRFSKNKRGRRFVLIAGGQDKNLDFGKMASATKKKVTKLILLPGTAAEKLKKLLHKNKLGLVEVKSMPEAVKKAAKFARSGDFVILSPGAASFGLFANEFDRGKKFVDAVKKLNVSLRR